MLHPVRRHGRTETRLLYYFRTPPYVKVGRAALDPEAMSRLERQYPDIKFDWDKILREPPPQTLSEREATRRKDQRDARDARRKRKRLAEPAEPLPGDAIAPPDADLDGDEGGEGLEAGSDVLTSEEVSEPIAADAGATPGAPGKRRRRRRRRGKRRDGEPGGTPPVGAPPDETPPTDSV